MDHSLPLISVIVPVYNQWHMVLDLLHCLEQQTLPHEQFELLLIDNGSSDIPEFESEPGFVRRYVCTQPGSYSARNYGAARARGQLFAFTDADCRPRPDWLASSLQCYQKYDAQQAIIAGDVTIFPKNELSPNLFELYEMVLGIPQAWYVKRGYAATANLLVPRQIFERIEGFDSTRFSGGDADFCRRAVCHGAKMVYCSEAVVGHPARDSLNALITKSRRIKGGQLRAGTLRRRCMYAIRAFLPPVRAWRKIIISKKLSLFCKVRVCLVQARLWLTDMAEVIRLLVIKAQPERR